MKKALLGLAAFWILVLAGLGIFISTASRDVPPPDEAEFAVTRPNVALENNAFTYFLEATNLLVDTTNNALFVDFRMGKAPASAELRELIEKNAECLALVKRGTECAICLAPPVETIDTLTPYVNPWLHMQRILDARARLARLDGRFADAADDLAVGLRFGDLVQQNASSLIVYLVGMAISSTMEESVLELARDPAVLPDVLARLAHKLEESGSFDNGLVLALKAEHRMASNIVDELHAKHEGRTIAADLGMETNRFATSLLNSSYAFKPNQTKNRLAAYHRQWIKNATLIFAEMERVDSNVDEPGRFSLLLPNVFGKYLFTILMPSWEKLMKTKCQADGLLSGTKLVVACSRFQRDKGRWPDALGELVPDYLAEVPRDPFDGQPFRYSAEKGLVWAVGTNLTDEGGSTRVPGADKEYVASRNRNQAEDFVFELKPTTKAE